MRKLLIIPTVLLLISCKTGNDVAKPVEFYKGKGIVVLEQAKTSGWANISEVQCKTKDSLFYIYIHDFDAAGLKVGDTIK